jgi:hypothetical protein
MSFEILHRVALERTNVLEEHFTSIFRARRFFPIKNILCGVEKAIRALPEETAEEIQQEMIRIHKCSLPPKDDVTGAKQRALQSLKANDLLPILLADKGNAAIVLCASDYNQNTATLLEDKAYKKLKNDPMDVIECKTVLLLKMFPIADVCQQL